MTRRTSKQEAREFAEGGLESEKPTLAEIEPQSGLLGPRHPLKAARVGNEVMHFSADESVRF